jgi:hypothetical protein
MPTKVDSQTYFDLVSAYREVGGGKHEAAAALVKVPTAIAKAAWLRGCAEDADLFPPIKQAYEDELLKAKAHRQRLAKRAIKSRRKEMSLAIEDAAISRAIEGNVTRSGMLLSDQLITSLAGIIRKATPLGEILERKLTELANDEFEEHTIGELLALYSTIAKVTRDTADSVLKFQQAEHKYMGRPDIKVTHTIANVDEEIMKLMAGVKSLQPPIDAEFQALPSSSSSSSSDDLE